MKIRPTFCELPCSQQTDRQTGRNFIDFPSTESFWRPIKFHTQCITELDARKIFRKYITTFTYWM